MTITRIERKFGRMGTAPNRLRKQSPGPNPQIGTSDWRATVNGTRLDTFWSQVQPTGFCWEWTGKTNRDGYGYMWLDRTTKPVHRVSYENLVGTIPPSLTLDHLCRNKTCVNPDHLEPVTSAENTRRAFRVRGELTRCPYGHPYTEDNLLARAGRACRQCKRIQAHGARGGECSVLSPCAEHQTIVPTPVKRPGFCRNGHDLEASGLVANSRCRQCILVNSHRRAGAACEHSSFCDSPAHTGANGESTKCRKGHSMEGSYARPDGRGRQCRECRRERLAQNRGQK